MELPINKKEFEKILALLKHKDNALYAKLWCHKMNYMKEKNGIS